MLLVLGAASLDPFEDVLYPFARAKIQRRIEVNFGCVEEVDPRGEFFPDVALGGFQDLNDLLRLFALSRNMHAHSYFFHVRGDLNIGHLDPRQARIFEIVSDHFGDLEANCLRDAFVATAFHYSIIVGVALKGH